MSAASATPAAALCEPGRRDPHGHAGGRVLNCRSGVIARRPSKFRLFDNATRESETAAIIERIADLHASEPQSSIAVLVASRSHAAPIITGLEARRLTLSVSTSCRFANCRSSAIW